MNDFEEKARADIQAIVARMAADIHAEMTRPCVLHGPQLFSEGGKWFAALGDERTGILGMGDTAAEAMADFDRKWTTAPPTAIPESEDEEDHVINVNQLVEDAVSAKLEEAGIIPIGNGRRKH